MKNSSSSSPSFPPIEEFSNLARERKRRSEAAKRTDFRRVWLLGGSGMTDEASATLAKHGIRVEAVLRETTEVFRSRRQPVICAVPLRGQELLLRRFGLEVFALSDLKARFPSIQTPVPILSTKAILSSYDEQRYIWSRLADTRSKRTFVDLLRYAISWNDQWIPKPEPGLYFGKSVFQSKFALHFVDCGAFTGDTLRRFLKQRRSFRSYRAFEPDPENFVELESFVSGLPANIRKRIVIERAAVGLSPRTVRFSSGRGTSSRVDRSGSITVQRVPLDEKIGAAKVSFIKMDVEGQEIEALQGARSLIQSQRPGLAVSAYHRVADLWEVPRKILEIEGSYRLRLRHHDSRPLDTVCYASPAPPGSVARATSSSRWRRASER